MTIEMFLFLFLRINSYCLYLVRFTDTKNQEQAKRGRTRLLRVAHFEPISNQCLASGCTSASLELTAFDAQLIARIPFCVKCDAVHSFPAKLGVTTVSITPTETQ